MRAGAVDDGVPPAILDELQGLYQVSQARSRRVFRVVGEMFKAFKDAGIEAMALKDVHLARAVFPDPSLRPMGDIDILIRKEQYDSVDRCLTDIGFIARWVIRTLHSNTDWGTIFADRPITCGGTCNGTSCKGSGTLITKVILIFK